MQITIGKRIEFKTGQVLYYQDSMGNKAYYTVLDHKSTCRLRPATRWEIFLFKVLMPMRRLRRWALEHRKEM